MRRTWQGEHDTVPTMLPLFLSVWHSSEPKNGWRITFRLNPSFDCLPSQWDWPIWEGISYYNVFSAKKRESQESTGIFHIYTSVYAKQSRKHEHFLKCMKRKLRIFQRRNLLLFISWSHSVRQGFGHHICYGISISTQLLPFIALTACIVKSVRSSKKKVLLLLVQLKQDLVQLNLQFGGLYRDYYCRQAKSSKLL